MARLAFHRLAERELNEAAQYYELESLGGGPPSSRRSTDA
jgi:hypothetical protein